MAITSHKIVDVSNNAQIIDESTKHSYRAFFITIVYNRSVSTLDSDLEDYKEYMIEGYKRFFNQKDGFQSTLQVLNPELKLSDIQLKIETSLERSVKCSFLHFHTLVQATIPFGEKLGIDFTEFNRRYREIATPEQIPPVKITILNASPSIANIRNYINKYG